MSEKIGFVPNLRKRDNLYQGICVLAFLIMGLTIGWFWNGWPIGVLAGAFIGLVVGALVSGFAIMVLGFFRKS